MKFNKRLTQGINTNNSQANNDNDMNSDISAIHFCDSILREAVIKGASDIHIEPFAKTVFVRLRIDGKLQKISELSSKAYFGILARFKIMSELNIAERRIPQDGKISLEIDNNRYDFRVSTIPTIHGEKIVIRILDYTKSKKKKISDASDELNTLVISKKMGITLGIDEQDLYVPVRMAILIGESVWSNSKYSE